MELFERAPEEFAREKSFLLHEMSLFLARAKSPLHFCTARLEAIPFDAGEGRANMAFQKVIRRPHQIVTERALLEGGRTNFCGGRFQYPFDECTKSVSKDGSITCYGRAYSVRHSISFQLTNHWLL